MAAILADTCHEVRADLMTRQPCRKTVLFSESEKLNELMGCLNDVFYPSVALCCRRLTQTETKDSACVGLSMG